MVSTRSRVTFILIRRVKIWREKQADIQVEGRTPDIHELDLEKDSPAVILFDTL